MKTLRYLAVSLGVLVLAAGLCAKDFEGKIRFKMTGLGHAARNADGESAMFMNYFIKAGLIRMETEIQPGKVGCMIIDSAKREMTMLMPEQKMYMVMKTPEPRKTEGQAAPAQDAEIVRTGKTETILGYKCEQVIVKSKDGETETWSAEGLGTFHAMSRGGPMGRPAPASAWEKALADKGFFPLRVVHHDKSGKETMRMEAVSIDQQSVPDEMFVPPADYQKFEMPSIPGMGGFGRGSE